MVSWNWVFSGDQGVVEVTHLDKTSECPGDSFLRAYAAKLGSFPLSDSRVRHVTSCDHCLPALLDFRSATTARRPFQMRVAAVASLCAGCCIRDPRPKKGSGLAPSFKRGSLDHAARSEIASGVVSDEKTQDSFCEGLMPRCHELATF